MDSERKHYIYIYICMYTYVINICIYIYLFMLLVTICSIVFFPRPVCNGLHDWWVLVVNVGHHGVFLHPLDKAPVVGA